MKPNRISAPLSRLHGPLAQVLAVALLALTAVGAHASGSRGTQLDTYCAARAPAASPPQQSRPYRASGNSCALCHPNNQNTASSLNTLGRAVDPCSGSGGLATACQAATNPFCASTAPTSVSITTPAAGTTVAAGTAVTFQGQGTHPDGFPLAFTWRFNNGLPNANTTGTAVFTAQSSQTSVTPASSVTATFEVRDVNGRLAATQPTRSVTVNAPPANQAPNGTITPPATVTQGVAAAFQGSATDPDGDAVTYAWNFGANASPATSSVQNPSVTFTTTGARTVTLTVTDSRGLADPTPATVSVNVVAPPAANVAPEGTITPPATLVQGQAVSFQGSATDANGDTVTYAWNFGANASPATSTAQNPSVTFSTAGSRTVTLTVTDSRGLADPTPATVTVTVAPPPIPAACRDADRDGYSPDGGACGPRDCNDSNAAINPGARETCGDGIDNDCDGFTDAADRECNGTDCVANLVARPVVITQANWGPDDGVNQLEVQGSQAAPGAAVTLFNASNGTLLGTATAASGGSDDPPGEWEFEINTNTPPCRVRVEIDGAVAERAVSNAPSTCIGTANRAPNGTITPPATIVRGQPVTFQGAGTDPENNLPLSFAWTFGTSGVPASNAQSPTVTFPSTGTFTVTLTVRDSLGLADPTPATVSVTVTAPANRPPVATITAPTENVTVVQGGRVDFAGSGVDPDSDPMTFAWSFGGGTPTTAAVADPAPVTFNTRGTFTTRLTVRDSRGGTATATRTVTVVAPPAPVAGADGYTVAAGQSLVVAAPGLLGNDASPAGRTLTAQRVSGPSHGRLTLNANGSFSYRPASGFSGTDSFTYRASDGISTSAAATVTITVTPPNRAPNGTISSPAANITVTRGTAVAFQGTGTDPDGNLPLSFAWSFGTAAPASTDQNPTVTFGTNGTFTVRLTVRDAKGLADPTPATRTVTVVNPIVISQAVWADGELDVRGTGAPAATTVTLKNASTGTTLATARSGSTGSFRFEIEPGTAPCSVRVEAGTRTATATVSGAPANCAR